MTTHKAYKNLSYDMANQQKKLTDPYKKTNEENRKEKCMLSFQTK